MGMYNYIKNTVQSRTAAWKAAQRERLIMWRKENAITRIERPTNIVRARTLGYKPKEGILLARVRVSRGGKQRPQIKKGRRPTHSHQQLVMKKSYQRIAEERAAKRFSNCEILNSYKAGQDGKHYWFEIIVIDPCQGQIQADKNLRWICSERNRVLHGKTSAGRKGRGLRSGKGQGHEKHRPSLRAHKRLGK